MGAEDDLGPEIGYTGARFGGTPRRKARKRKAAAEAPSAEEMLREAAAQEAVTEVFAAVSSAAAREDAPEDTAERPGGSDRYDGPDGDDSPVGYTGARFGGASRWRRKSAPDRESRQSQQEASQQDESPRTGVVPVPPPLPGIESHGGYFDPASSSSVRPYVFTRGRTRSQLELSLEGLVSVVPTAPTGHMSGEHHAVLGLCREPRSVAEVAALLDVPLGVARVLVGDLAAAGAVALHRTAGAAGPDIALLERVLSGLRRL
ncbi:hypothetical protein GCM10009609_22130 [Pseudonocardia aurantiaca]|uniref:DUF742 domain-containing protein n=1 Tax=Pseudonocardia aurantiaca TaxID=75290 RepID=A0ABW4FEX7_9PSEU